MDAERTVRGDPVLGQRQRVGIAFALDVHLRAVAADPRDLRRRRDRRDEHVRRDTAPLRGERDGGAVVAAGRGGDSSGRNVAQQEVGERTARLERAGVLQQFQLEHDRLGSETEVGAGDVCDRRPAHVRFEQRVRGSDALRAHPGASTRRSVSHALAALRRLACSSCSRASTVREA